MTLQRPVRVELRSGSATRPAIRAFIHHWTGSKDSRVAHLTGGQMRFGKLEAFKRAVADYAIDQKGKLTVFSAAHDDAVDAFTYAREALRRLKK